MSNSELVVAEIVDLLPLQHRESQREWVRGELATNSPADVLAVCKEYLGVSNAQVLACQRSLESQGIAINRVEAKLDAHTAYTDQRFQAVNQQMSELNQQIAVTTAVNNERQNTNQFLTGQMMSSINSTQQSVVTAAAKPSNQSNSNPSYFGAMMIPFIVVPLVLLALGSLATIGNARNTQTIEYKNVPSNGHPKPIPKEMYDRL